MKVAYAFNMAGDQVVLAKNTEHKCIICGAVSAKTVSGDMLKCRNCGTMFVFPETCLDPAKIYHEGYFKGGIYRDYIGEEHVRTKLFEEKFDLVREHLPERGRLLDVGCAAGFFLKVARDHNYQTYGVEISQYASNYARDVLKLNVITGNFLDTHLPERFFDIVTMWDVLEHFSDPLQALTKAREALNKSGTLLVETLNTDSLAFRIFGRNHPLFAPSYHCVFFNVKTLKRMLDKSGFRAIWEAPIQSYVRTPRGYRTLRYFKYRLLRGSFGKLFNDVILVAATTCE